MSIITSASETTMNRLNQYIDKCIEDAKSANNMNDEQVRYWFTVIGKDLLLHLEGNYKIANRVEYRLSNNLPKHYGLTLNTTRSSGTLSGDQLFNASKFALFSADKFSVVEGLCEATILGRHYVICAKSGNRPASENSIEGIKLLMANGLDFHAHGRDRWVSFMKAYLTTYRMDPMEAYLLMQEGKDPDPKKAYGDLTKYTEKDLAEFGCRYYSVCSAACEKCKQACTLPKPVYREGIIANKWNEMRDDQIQKKINELN